MFRFLLKDRFFSQSRSAKLAFVPSAAFSILGSLPLFAAGYTKGGCRETGQTLQMSLSAHSRVAGGPRGHR